MDCGKLFEVEVAVSLNHENNHIILTPQLTQNPKI
jgi:hypothetical protein